MIEIVSEQEAKEQVLKSAAGYHGAMEEEYMYSNANNLKQMALGKDEPSMWHW